MAERMRARIFLEVPRLRLPHPFATAARFVGDGSRALTAGEDGRVLEWDLARGEVLRRLDVSFPIRDLVVAPDGAWFVVVGSPRVLRVDLARWTYRVIHGGKTSYASLALSRHGTLLALAGAKQVGIDLLELPGGKVRSLSRVLVVYPAARVLQVRGGLLLRPAPCHVKRSEVIGRDRRPEQHPTRSA